MDIDEWVIDWGDGEPLTHHTGDFHAQTSTTAPHTYADNGTYQIEVTPYNDSNPIPMYGELDGAFGAVGSEPAGWVTEDFSGDDAKATQVLVQPDGKILVAGYSYDSDHASQSYDFALARYNSDGTLDNDFGIDGLIVTDLGGDDRCYDMALQSDGKIVLVGYSDAMGDMQVALVRYTTDGKLDAGAPEQQNDGFGCNDGIVLESLTGNSDYAYGLTILPESDDIIIVGKTDEFWCSDAIVARFDDNGILDADFGDDGSLSFTGGGDWDLARAVEVLWLDEVDPSNTVLVAVGAYGSGSFGENNHGLFFFDASGSPANIGNNGVIQSNIANGTNDEAYDLVVDRGNLEDESDDRIITTGVAGDDFAITRFVQNGDPIYFVLDTDFDIDSTSGTSDYCIDFDSGYDHAMGVTLLPSGQIVASGYATINGQYDFALVVLNGSNGSLDKDFANDGTLSMNFGSGNDRGIRTAADQNGDILVAGYVYVDGQNQFGLTRFHGSASAVQTIQVVNQAPEITITTGQKNTSGSPFMDVVGQYLYHNDTGTPIIEEGMMVTGCFEGIIGVAVDVVELQPEVIIDVSDFRFRVGNTIDPSTWIEDPVEYSGEVPTNILFEVYEDGGDGGADRIAISWAEDSIVEQWLEVTILASGDVGVAEDYTFYFGSMPGDANSDGSVNTDDFSIYGNNQGQSGVGVSGADFNLDNVVDVNDLAIIAYYSGRSLVTMLEELTIQWSAIDPGDDAITGWIVNWGDGTAIGTLESPLPAGTAQLSHRYALTPPEYYDILVTAIDEDGSHNESFHAIALAERMALSIDGDPYNSPTLSWSTECGQTGFQIQYSRLGLDGIWDNWLYDPENEDSMWPGTLNSTQESDTRALQTTYYRIRAVNQLNQYIYVSEWSMPLRNLYFSEDSVVELSATVVNAFDNSHIRLSWPIRYGEEGSAFTIKRRKLGNASLWDNVPILATVEADHWIDNSSDFEIGTMYEYQVISDRLNHGQITAGVEIPLEDDRGEIILLVDNRFTEDLASGLAKLEADLVGDGWHVLRHDLYVYDENHPDDTMGAVEVKQVIQNDYSNPAYNVKAAYLFGHFPLAKSGYSSPDGHGFTSRAADVYYGDVVNDLGLPTVNEDWWPDLFINGTTTNQPDGVFDWNSVEGVVELQVGRVDMHDLNGFTLNGVELTETELMQRYLDKTHDFRYGITEIGQQVLIAQSTEGAMVRSGWRNASGLVGWENVTSSSVMMPHNDTYLFGFDSTTGSVTWANTNLSYSNLRTLPLPTVFTTLTASYCLDWYKTDNLLRSMLANDGYCLTASWGPDSYSTGNGFVFYYEMGLGGTIGEAFMTTQNEPAACAKVYYNLMGDPSLRMHVVHPVSNITTTDLAGAVRMTWDRTVDDDAVYEDLEETNAYLVYRADSISDEFSRVENITVRWNEDTGHANGGYLSCEIQRGYVYMIRAVKLEETPSGTYYNASQGVFCDVPTEVVGQYLFHNATSDPVIEQDMTVTGFSHGIVGVAIDMEGLPSGVTLDASDFRFRVGNTSDPSTWIEDPVEYSGGIPSNISFNVLEGTGVDDADRITIHWANDSIVAQWLEVTVLASGDVGVPEDYTFIFGSLPGDADGDGIVGTGDLGVVGFNWGLSGVGISGGNFNLDNVVGTSDLSLVGYYYNQSLIDLNAAAMVGQYLYHGLDCNGNPIIEEDMTVTGYDEGIVGVAIDIDDLPSHLNPTTDITAADFVFEVWDAVEDEWVAGPTPASVTVHLNEGASGADRIAITWNDDSIKAEWLRVKVLDSLLGSEEPGRAAEYDFIFGSLPGDANGDGSVNGTDGSILSANWQQSNVGIECADFNLDGIVDSLDQAILSAYWGQQLEEPGE
ncbi:MAG TPA: dockerin type I domain-containing protein [Thermoguttaceae bacterium]|nr:dockerin type I domain-containing protein [Thermoguttaceae bacterium]